jgi:hypothetical protein
MAAASLPPTEDMQRSATSQGRQSGYTSCVRGMRQLCLPAGSVTLQNHMRPLRSHIAWTLHDDCCLTADLMLSARDSLASADELLELMNIFVQRQRCMCLLPMAHLCSAGR